MHIQKKPSDGQVVSMVEVKLHPKLDEVETFRLEYMVDGLRVVGYLSKPKIVHSKKLPVLLYNRGGNREFGKIDEERLNRLASYASRNYVVLASQYRGNDGGEGKEEFGGRDVKDVFALSWLADTLPYVDPFKKFMFGHSRGGMMSYICIKLGIDIKAAAVVGAPANLLREPLAFPMEIIHSELIGDKATEKNKYIDRSAIHWPEKINVPLLIQHGQKDQRVSVEDAIELSELLRKHRKNHKLVIHPDGDHRLSGNEYTRDQEIFDWFEKNS